MHVHKKYTLEDEDDDALHKPLDKVDEEEDEQSKFDDE
jgi:hypothetical protein